VTCVCACSFLLQVLGPVATLFSCERKDVACALSSFLGDRLHWWIMLKDDRSKEVVDYLERTGLKSKVGSVGMGWWIIARGQWIKQVDHES